MPGELSPLFENQEELKAAIPAVTVEGTIPPWIHGTYLRVGPGIFDVGKVKLNHFTDGYSLLSKFDVKDGQVNMHTQFLRSEAYKKAMEHKEPYFPEFSTKGNIGSQKSFLSRLAGSYNSVDVTDNDSMNVFKLGDEVFAATETMHITRVKTDDLETSDRVDYSKIFGTQMASSHALIDDKGDWYNIGTSISATSAKYQVMTIPKFGKLDYKEGLKKAKVIATISPSNRGYLTYYHSFGMTQNFIMFVEQPWSVDRFKLIDSKLKGNAIRDLFQWDPKAFNIFHIVDKRDGKLYTTKFQSDAPFFFFHFANCFEDGETIVADILAFPNSSVVDELEVDHICARRVDKSGNSFAQIQRYAIPLVKNVKDVTVGENLITLSYTTATAIRSDDKIILTPQRIGEPGLESPDINPRKRRQRHRFIYGSGLHSRSAFANSLGRVDLETGEMKLWKGHELLFPGDPKFIARGQAGSDAAEDDGVLVAACCDMKPGAKDFLVFVNAATMEEEGRAVFNHPIPQSIHSIFLPSESS